MSLEAKERFLQFTNAFAIRKWEDHSSSNSGKSCILLQPGAIEIVYSFLIAGYCREGIASLMRKISPVLPRPKLRSMGVDVLRKVLHRIKVPIFNFENCDTNSRMHQNKVRT